MRRKQDKKWKEPTYHDGCLSPKDLRKKEDWVG